MSDFDMLLAEIDGQWKICVYSFEYTLVGYLTASQINGRKV